MVMTIAFIVIVLTLIGIAVYLGAHAGRTETKAGSSMNEQSGTGPFDLS